MDKQGLFAGRFKVVDVHEGGMAQVLICHDIHNGRFVAAKNPNKAPEYFSREARLWLGLGYHPNIVRAHIVHKVDGKPYLFMDFIGDSKGNSHNLRHEFNKKKIPLSLILKTGISVIRALKHARSIFPGFVHRDIKPENILINDEGNIFVSDFGIGHLPKYGSIIDCQTDNKTTPYDMISPISTSFTKVGSFSGTIGYAAPEQYIDSSSVTFKADMFSLGVILYEALTGRMPFNPHAIQEEGVKILQDTPDFDSVMHSTVPTELRSLLIKMLQFLPANRPESLDVIVNTFEHLVKQTSERAEKQVAVKQTATDSDYITLSNRIYSLMQLDELPLAKRATLELVRKHPWHFESPVLTRTLCMKLGDKLADNFLRKIVGVDLLNPVKFIPVLLIGFILSIPIFMTYSGTQQAVPEFFFIKSQLSLIEIISAFLLILILLSEKYINSRTGITLDIITLPGLILGIISSFLFSAMGYSVLAGSGLKSIAGVLLGGVSLLFVAISYEYYTHREGLGGGTIKLCAMIGSFTGFMIIPIILVATGCLILQRVFLLVLEDFFQKELKWVNGRLSPGFFSKYNFQQLPTSNALMIATWVVISWPGFIRYLLNM